MSVIKKKSKMQERKVAKELKGRTTPASGSIAGMKGDVRTKRFLVECKYTDKDYYKLKREVWEKIKKEALKDNLRIPLLQINIQDFRIAVIDENDFEYFSEDINTIHDLIVKGDKEITLHLDMLEDTISDFSCVKIEDWKVFLIKYDRDFSKII